MGEGSGWGTVRGSPHSGSAAGGPVVCPRGQGERELEERKGGRVGALLPR